VSARDGIQQTLAQYALGMDESREDLLAGSLAEDIVMHFPGMPRTLTGRDEVLAFLGERRAARADGGEQGRHVITNLFIAHEGDDDVSTVAYFTLVRTGAEGAYASSGWYKDRLVRAGGRWVIAERTVHSDRGGPAKFSPFE
jgi:SnoaL-like domain